MAAADVLLFSYGTLRLPEVQLSTFGRLLEGHDDAVVGYRLDWVTITDSHVIAASGSDRHPILVATDEPDAWEATRARVAVEGFGARLLARQDSDGQWDGGAFFPANFDFHGPEADVGQPWTATTWTLNALREWGLDPAVLRERRTAELLAVNSRWEYENLPYWGGEVDCCINAWTGANGGWLGADVTGLVDWFLTHRLPDGGWNCDWVEGATRSSFHSTLASLKGLLAHDVATGGTDATRAARRSGEEYLLPRTGGGSRRRSGSRSVPTSRDRGPDAECRSGVRGRGGRPPTEPPRSCRYVVIPVATPASHPMP